MTLMDQSYYEQLPSDHFLPFKYHIKASWEHLVTTEMDTITLLEIKNAHNDFQYYIESARQLSRPIADFQYKVINHFMTSTRGGVIMPRGHGKSELISESLVAWLLAFRPGIFIVILSASEKLARERLSNIKYQLTEPVWKFGAQNPLRSLAPSLKPNVGEDGKWNSGEVILKNGSRVMALGSGADIRGLRKGKRRPDIVVIDDIVPEKPGKDTELRKWFTESISNLGHPDTRFFFVGTPRRMTDLIEFIKNNKRYKVIKLKAIDDNGRPLWKDLWSHRQECCNDPLNPCYHAKNEEERIRAHLQMKMEEVGSIAWTREYLCEVVSDEDSLFPVKILRRNIDESLSYGDEPIGEEFVVIGCDLAIGTGESNDYTVFTVLATTENPRSPIRLLDMKLLHGASYNEQYMILEQLYNKYSPIEIMVETNAYQRYFVERTVENNPMMPLVSTITGTEKHFTTVGIPSLRTLFENEIVRLPYRTQEDKWKTDQFIQELTMWIVDEKGKVINNDEHDDRSMSFLIAIKSIREYKKRRMVFVLGDDEMYGDDDNDNNGEPRIDQEKVMREFINAYGMSFVD